MPSLEVFVNNCSLGRRPHRTENKCRRKVWPWQKSPSTIRSIGVTEPKKLAPSLRKWPILIRSAKCCGLPMTMRNWQGARRSDYGTLTRRPDRTGRRYLRLSLWLPSRLGPNSEICTLQRASALRLRRCQEFYGRRRNSPVPNLPRWRTTIVGRYSRGALSKTSSWRRYPRDNLSGLRRNGRGEPAISGATGNYNPRGRDGCIR